MRINQQFQCEICKEVFDNKEICSSHELTCNPVETRWCYKCGKTETWNIRDEWASTRNEEWHEIDLGMPGYGSLLDGSEVKFSVCDDCLYNFVDTFTTEGQEKIHNSGSNMRLPTNIWIREAKGELTDEEYEEYSMHSPRQIKAYQERFPVCDKVVIYEHRDKSKGSYCLKFAFGDSEGQADECNFSGECFGCELFEKRHEDKSIPIVYECK
ncbi:hypothetical protein ABHN03_25305 [Paenibacillus sp. NRS-1775]|uniref:hypothetical protein n=1 Tax=unclassified Paenibacillus TaxID=185978 RepID=UPI003D273D8F